MLEVMMVKITSILYIHVWVSMQTVSLYSSKCCLLSVDQGRMSSRDPLYNHLEIQLTVNFSLCSHGYTGVTVTHCILHRHSHFILGRGREIIQCCRDNILSK